MTFEEWKRLRTAIGKNTPISADEIWSAATAAEREACAETVESESQDCTRYEFAEAIRARSTSQTPYPQS